MADPQTNPIPQDEQPVVPDNPITDPKVGMLPTPGSPQPDNIGDNPPNVDQRISVLEQKVAHLEALAQPPGQPTQGA